MILFVYEFGVVYLPIANLGSHGIRTDDEHDRFSALN